jgi:hypothetical protein
LKNSKKKDEKAQETMGQHLKKTLINDMLNELIKFSAEEQMIRFEVATMTNDVCNFLPFNSTQ